MSLRKIEYFSISLLCLVVASTLFPFVGYSNHFSSIGNSGAWTSTLGSASSKRTLGNPVSGYWNHTQGAGGLAETILLGSVAAKSPPPGGLPNSFSWNGYFGGSNYMTPVKSQGSCGSCWAFAAVGDMEAQYKIGIANPSTGIDLSEQNVLSCSAGDCSGWYLSGTLDFLQTSGTPDEACCPYVASKTPCGSGRCSDYLSKLYYITGWSWISTDTANIKNFLYARGPVMVWMPVFSDFPWYDATFWQYHFYSHAPSGSYGGHLVIIVGWDDQGSGTGDDYWIVKNSWGTSGGDVNSGYGGYFYMTQNPTNGFFGISQNAAVISGVSAPNSKPSISSFTSDKSSPQTAGTTIVWACTASDPDAGDTILYRFWRYHVGVDSSFTTVQDWSTSNTYSWVTSSADAGNTMFAVWVRDGHHAGTGGQDDWRYGNAGSPFTIQEVANSKPSISSFTSDKSSPQTAGTTIVWACTASDPDAGDTILYRFWRYHVGVDSSFTTVQDWSTSNTYSWVTSSADAGNTMFAVWVRDGHHAGTGGQDDWRYGNAGSPFQIRP